MKQRAGKDRVPRSSQAKSFKMGLEDQVNPTCPAINEGFMTAASHVRAIRRGEECDTQDPEFGFGFQCERP